MTDQPGNDREERLPAPRPETPASVERFSAPPGAHKFELTPERSAQIVRQSSNARWVGFLAVIVVVLFVALYWFYELGAPLGITQSRLGAEENAQQVLAVERGYNIYEANCARCHGHPGRRRGRHRPRPEPPGQAVPAPQRGLPPQHPRGRRPARVRRSAIGDADLVERGPPARTAQLRADRGADRVHPRHQRHDLHETRPRLLEPRIDPRTGEVETFTGWRDPNYEPAPDATPYPECWKTEFTG